MSIAFTFKLTCGQCETALTYTDERPAWKTYDYRVEQPDECEKSARFVAEHADEPVPDLSGFEPWAAWEQAGEPRFIRPRRGGLELSIPDPYRYIDCPVCDAHVREPKTNLGYS